MGWMFWRKSEKSDSESPESRPAGEPNGVDAGWDASEGSEALAHGTNPGFPVEESSDGPHLTVVSGELEVQVEDGPAPVVLRALERSLPADIAGQSVRRFFAGLGREGDVSLSIRDEWQRMSAERFFLELSAGPSRASGKRTSCGVSMGNIEDAFSNFVWD